MPTKEFGIIADKCSTPIILGNKGKEANYGGLCTPLSENNDEFLWVFTPAGNDKAGGIGSISGFGSFDYPADKPYFHYVKGDFIENPMSIDAEFLHRKIATFDITTHLEMPLGNLLNWLYRNGKEAEQREHTRLVLTPDGYEEMQRKMIIAKFDVDGVFVHPNKEKVHKAFRIANGKTKIPLERVKPGARYWANVIGEDDEFFYVNVHRRFKPGILFGLHESKNGYYVQENKEINNILSSYHPDRVLALPLFHKTNMKFKPVHMQASVIYDNLELFKGFDSIHLGIGWINPEKHEKLLGYPMTSTAPVIMIEGVQASDDDPLVRVFMATMNPKISGWRC